MNTCQTHITQAESPLAHFKAYIKRKAQGHIPYDYLVPAGLYQEQWN